MKNLERLAKNLQKFAALALLLFSFAFFSLLTGTPHAHAGGDLVNNGGGIAEKNVFYAYRGLGKYIDLCLTLDGCKLSTSQKSLLAQIKQGLAQEYKNTDQLQFGSEQKTPGFFIIDGEVKIAKTGSQIASPIFINVDLLYAKNEHGIYSPLTLYEAVAILIHELGHHYGTATHAELDLLGVKVAILMTQKIYTSPLLPWSNDVQLTVVNYDSTNSFPDVVLIAGDDMVDLSALYRKTIHCPILTIPIPIFPIPDWDVASVAAKASLLHNLHWEKAKGAKDKAKLKLSASISNKCEDAKNLLYLNNNFRLTLEFRLQRINGVWHVDQDSIEMSQHKDPWWKLLRLPSFDI